MFPLGLEVVIPELNGKLIGAAQRIPTPTGSTTMLNAVVSKASECHLIGSGHRDVAVAKESACGVICHECLVAGKGVVYSEAVAMST